jgi:hypothetical protein
MQVPQFGAGLRPRRPRDRRSPPPTPQRRTDEFFQIPCCTSEYHLVKPRSAIDLSLNPNPNHGLRIEPISPRLGSFVHFPGFSSLLDPLSYQRPQDFFAPQPDLAPIVRTPLAACSLRPSASSAKPSRLLAFFLPCRSVSSVVNSSIVNPGFPIRRAQHPPAARTEAPSTNTIYKNRKSVA